MTEPITLNMSDDPASLMRTVLEAVAQKFISVDHALELFTSDIEPLIAARTATEIADAINHLNLGVDDRQSPHLQQGESNGLHRAEALARARADALTEGETND